MMRKVPIACLSVFCGLTLLNAVAAGAAPYAPPAMQVVNGARLQTISDAWIRRLVKDPRHQALLAYPVMEQRVLSGHTELRESASPVLSPEYVSLPVEIRVDGMLMRTVYIGYRIVTFVKKPVLTLAKHRGDLLSASDFRDEMRADDGRPPVDATMLAGRICNVDFAAGSVVQPEETSVDQIVKAGSPVILIVHDGGVALAADVIARTSGGFGETVTVYDEPARKMLSGLVTAPSRVELTLPEVSDL